MYIYKNYIVIHVFIPPVLKQFFKEAMKNRTSKN